MKKLVVLTFLLAINLTTCSSRAIEPNIDHSAPDPLIYPIHFCAYFNLHSLIDNLIDSGEYLVDQSDHLERTPLHYAALNGHKKTIEVLLNHGSEPYVFDRSRRLPEELAYICGYHALSDKLKNYRIAKAHADSLAASEHLEE